MTTITALFAATLLFLAIRELRAVFREHERTVRQGHAFNEYLIKLDDKEE